MYDELYKYMFAGFVIASGLFVGFTIVSHYVYKPMIDDGNKITYLSEKEIETNEYVEKYDDEYEELELVEMSKENLKDLSKNYLTEETPEGVVKMYYCAESESFVYWCQKQVPYKILEAVSKKYVIEYDCKMIHTDMNYELEKKRKELMDSVDENVDKTEDDKTEDDKTDDDKTDDDNSVFVTFKNYKKPDLNKEKINKKNKNDSKKLLLCDKANRYSYRGAYEKCADIPNNGEKSVKNISFSEFMKAKNTFNNVNTDSASDGFWRFLDINYVAEQLKPETVEFTNKDIVIDSIKKAGGYFKFNGVQFESLDKYHKAVMQELKMNVSCNSSDNSYDVLECENENNDRSIVEDLSNNVIDSSEDEKEDELKKIASSSDVQSGNRISRGGSVDSQDSQSRGWLW